MCIFLPRVKLYTQSRKTTKNLGKVFTTDSIDKRLITNVFILNTYINKKNTNNPKEKQAKYQNSQLTEKEMQITLKYLSSNLFFIK